MVPKASTFPSGMKELAGYVHERGLKLGIYSDAGYIIMHLFINSLFQRDFYIHEILIYFSVLKIFESKCL